MILSVVKIFQVSQHPRSWMSFKHWHFETVYGFFCPPQKNTENYETKEMRDLKVDYDQKDPYIFQISFPASTYLFILFNDSFQAQSKEFVRTLFHEAFSYRSDAGQCPLKGFFLFVFQCTIYFRLLAFRIFSKQHIYEDVIRSTDCLKSRLTLSFSGLILKFQSQD